MSNSGSRMLGSFPTTHWSEVARAGDASPHTKRAALERLLMQYLPAFRAHLLYRHRFSAEDVEDLIQGFACDQVVARNLIAAADRNKGRLRSFLLTALERYVGKAWRGERAIKRSRGAPPLSTEELSAEPADSSPSATHAFDLAWARQVVLAAVEMMRKECEASARQRIWTVFQARVLDPMLNELPVVEYPELATRCGFDTPRQAANALTTAKRMFARALRCVVGQYASQESEISAELSDLQAILSRG